MMPELGLSPRVDSKTRNLKESSVNIVFSLFKAIYSYVNSFGRLRLGRGLRLLVLGVGLWMMGVSAWGQTCSITGGVETICSGNTTTWDATPGMFSYSWTGPSGFISINPSVTIGTAGVYTVTISDGTNTNSCSRTLSVNPIVTPSVTISTSPSTNICAGTSVTFTANPFNGGLSPSFQWQISVNGGTSYTDISGATASTYTSTTLSNGNRIRVVMTSNEDCPSINPVTSGYITMTVNINVTPSVSIIESANPICAGGLVTFSIVNQQNTGTSPTYQWQSRPNLTGTWADISGATGTTYSSNTLSNGNQIRLLLNSSVVCTTINPAESNVITANVNPLPTAIISGSTTICNGNAASASVTLTGTPPGILHIQMEQLQLP